MRNKKFERFYGCLLTPVDRFYLLVSSGLKSGNVRFSIFLAAFAAKQWRNVALFASLRALRETKTGYYLKSGHFAR